MNTTMLQDRQKVDVYLTSKLRKLLEAYCEQNKVSMSNVMRHILIKFLRGEGILND